MVSNNIEPQKSLLNKIYILYKLTCPLGKELQS